MALRSGLKRNVRLMQGRISGRIPQKIPEKFPQKVQEKSQNELDKEFQKDLLVEFQKKYLMEFQKESVKILKEDFFRNHRWTGGKSKEISRVISRRIPGENNSKSPEENSNSSLRNV